MKSLLGALLIGAMLGTAAHADEGKDEARGKDKWEKHQSHDDRRQDKDWEKRGKWEKERDKDWEKRAKQERKDREKQAKEERKDWEKRREARDDDRRGERHGKWEDRHARRERSYFHEHGYTSMRVPNGHLPPPGECRVWYPDRPAGHQPPPGNCARLSARVPNGAWLVQRPGSAQRVHVSVYDPYQPAVIVDRGVFDLRGGTLVYISQLR